MTNIIKQDSKTIVDLLFDRGLFSSELTRDNLNAIEEFISYTMQSRLDSYIKCNDIIEKASKTS